MGIPAAEWETKWLPVLEKYFLHLDLWLAGYGDPFAVSGETGALTMAATYRIPADELKTQAKYVIGQMLYDNDLMTLLLPYVTMEQRMTYLNPSMVYFYEACIDALPLSGDIVLSREMSARGEIVSNKVELPIPELPAEVADPMEDALAAVFGLSDEKWLSGMNRVEIFQNAGESGICLSGEKSSISIVADVTKPNEYTTAYDGMIRIVPVDAGETAVAAAFTCAASHRIWQDEKYLDHDTSVLSFDVEPAKELLAEDDPLKARCVAFKPVGFEFKVDYRNNPYQENSAVQINYDLNVTLPDAAVQASAVLRITTQMKMETLPVTGAENVQTMTEERKHELLMTFVENAAHTMQNLSGTQAEEAPVAQPTAVPPMNE